MQLNFELTGIMPLLMHADDVEASDQLQAWRRSPENKNRSVAGDDRSPAWTWQTYCYSDGENIVMPSDNIMVALRSAGSQMILKKQKTYKEITQSGMLITTEFCEFRAGNDRPVPMSFLESVRELSFKEQADKCRDAGFRLFAKRARVGMAKHVRVRPRFDKWSVRGSLMVMAPELTFEAVSQLFELAGRVGLCDWRPGCKTPGAYGMFSAKVTQ